MNRFNKDTYTLQQELEDTKEVARLVGWDIRFIKEVADLEYSELELEYFLQNNLAEDSERMSIKAVYLLAMVILFH